MNYKVVYFHDNFLGFDLDSVHPNNVTDLKDFGMLLQLFTEDGAANIAVGLIGDLQTGAEICYKKLCGREESKPNKRSHEPQTNVLFFIVSKKFKK